MKIKLILLLIGNLICIDTIAIQKEHVKKGNKEDSKDIILRFEGSIYQEKRFKDFFPRLDFKLGYISDSVSGNLGRWHLGDDFFAKDILISSKDLSLYGTAKLYAQISIMAFKQKWNWYSTIFEVKKGKKYIIRFKGNKDCGLYINNARFIKDEELKNVMQSTYLSSSMGPERIINNNIFCIEEIGIEEDKERRAQELSKVLPMLPLNVMKIINEY